MAIRNLKLGGTNLGDEKGKPSDWNDTFDAVAIALPPVGAVIPWLKSFTGTPALEDGWVECNGQTLSDAESVYDGETIPDLNGDNRFMRGNSTSGGTGGAETHMHSYAADPNTFESTGGDGMTNEINHLPPYMNVVWIMRIK